LLQDRKIGKLRELSPLWEMYKEGIDLNSVQWAMGGTLKPPTRPAINRRATWHTAKRSSTTTKTRATSAAFDKGDDGVGTGMVGAPACGDVMKLQIKVNETGVIEDAKFKTYGCGSAIASSSLVTEWVKGKTLDQAMEIRTPDRRGTGAAAGEDPLLDPGRGRDQGGGCRSGLAYKLEYADEVAPEDLVFEDRGVKVLIDPKSLPYLDGTELDFVREGLNEGFKFINPKEKDRCGCGESFRV
jgi:iron-sulfur cluster assembly accessory protein